jgi:hypothetical protein
MHRDRVVVDTFRKHGAKLVDAHGSLVPMNRSAFEEVPPNTVVIFLSEIGYCSSVPIVRQFANDFFTSKTRLEGFFRGAAAFQGRHYGNAYNRTYLPGEKYPSVMLQFWDARKAGMGWVYKLPLTRPRTQNDTENAPAASEVNYPKINNGNNPRGPHHIVILKDLMTRLGPGVYIVGSCIVPSGQIQNMYPVGRLPMSLPARMTPGVFEPARGWKRIGPIRTRETIRVGLHSGAGVKKATARRPQRPGTPAMTRVRNVFRSVPARRPGRITVRTALQRLSRVANLVNAKKLHEKLNVMLPYMNANVNTGRLRKVIEYLKNPIEFLSKINNANATMNFYNTNKLNKGAFIYNRI